MFRIIKVKGNSMMPDLKDGDYLLIRTFYKKPAVGQIMVLEHPIYGTLVKQVSELMNQGSCCVKSLNPAGLNQQQLGTIKPEHIIGIKLLHIKQPQSKY